MDNQEILDELISCEKHLSDEYKNSNYYADYLKKVGVDMSNNLKIEEV